jgi:threonine/homoserine/homoserine lactone efflux protein
MLGIQQYSVFLLSGLLVNLTPGQDTLYILGRSVAQGRRAGILSVLGICTGAMIHTMAAAFGLSALLTASSVAYHVMKYAGAAYLVYLGARMFPGASEVVDVKAVPEGSSALSIYVQGMLTDLLNPNVILFYLAFLPQFVSPAREYGALPFLLLGCTFIATGMTWCLIVACFASSVSEHFRRKPRTAVILRRVTGGLFVILGLRMALMGAS